MPGLVLLFVGIGIIAIVVMNSTRNSKRADEERQRRKQERRNYIYQKYGRGEVADNILRPTVWIGETADQLLDSLGKPDDIDEKVLKTKKKEVWKYFPTGANRYGLRITLENGIVLGWDEKMQH